MASVSGALGFPAAEADSLVGAALDERYVVDRVLGEGGMARVYHAYDRVEQRVVAIKVLRAGLARDPAFMERFGREALAVSRITSQRVVRILGVGLLPDGSRYYAMEHLVGETLEARRNRMGVLPVAEVIAIALQLVEGLAAAHAQGVVHRDLKPDNVFVLGAQDPAQPIACKILDFGIAKLTFDNSRTAPGSVLGTPLYMSPEQASGRGIDTRSDIYSLGVVIYELATGRPPFDGNSAMEIMVGHVTRKPTPIRALCPHLPRELDALVLRCLAKKREDRFATMHELGEALAAVPLPRAGSHGAVPESGREAIPQSGVRLSAGGTVVMPPPPSDAKTKVYQPPRARIDARLALILLLLVVLAVAASLGTAWFYG